MPRNRKPSGVQAAIADFGATLQGYGQGARALGEDALRYLQTRSVEQMREDARQAAIRGLIGFGVAGANLSREALTRGPDHAVARAVVDAVNPIPAIRDAAVALNRAKRSGGRSDWKQATVAALGAAAAATPAGKPGAVARTGAEASAAGRGLSRSPKRVAFGTHEDTPGVMTGHLPALVASDDATRAAYARDPRSGWVVEGRDALYDAAGMTQRPTQYGTGVYTPPGGATEVNPSRIARPEVAVEGGQLVPQDRAVMDTVEALRGYLDAQGAGAWHMTIPDAPADRLSSLFVPHDGQMTAEQIMRLREIGARHGIGDVVDTGQGATMTNFYPGPPPAEQIGEALGTGLARQLREALGSDARRVSVESGYLGYEDAWPEGINSGAATRQLFEYADPEVLGRLETPEVRMRALEKAQRDEALAMATGQPVREDVLRARRAFATDGVAGLRRLLDLGLAPSVALAILGAGAFSGVGSQSSTDQPGV